MHQFFPHGRDSKGFGKGYGGGKGQGKGYFDGWGYQNTGYDRPPAARINVYAARVPCYRLDVQKKDGVELKPSESTNCDVSYFCTNFKGLQEAMQLERFIPVPVKCSESKKKAAKRMKRISPFYSLDMDDPTFELWISGLDQFQRALNIKREGIDDWLQSREFEEIAKKLEFDDESQDEKWMMEKCEMERKHQVQMMELTEKMNNMQSTLQAHLQNLGVNMHQQALASNVATIAQQLNVGQSQCSQEVVSNDELTSQHAIASSMEVDHTDRSKMLPKTPILPLFLAPPQDAKTFAVGQETVALAPIHIGTPASRSHKADPGSGNPAAKKGQRVADAITVS